jgi:hypothetical protein
MLINLKRCLGALCLALLLGSAAQASTLWVNCAAKGGFNTIGSALKLLQNAEPAGPNTINVSGACHENLLIKNLDLLTIAGSNGASITDASGGTADVIDIRASRVTLIGLTIDALNSINYDAVDCEQASQCTLTNNTLQGGADNLGVYSLASAHIVGGVIQNGTSDGIFGYGDVLAAGVLIQGNPVGVVVTRGARVRLSIADPAFDPIRATTATTVANNNGAGVQVSAGAEFHCSGCIVSDNAGDGIHLDVSVAASIVNGFLANGSTVPPVITRNAGSGVYVGDLSSATFKGTSFVTGNGQSDISCNSPTSVTRNALAAAGAAARTNCTN